MGIYTILLPDVGEGIAEAELAGWDVKIGDVVKEDDVLGTVMTDKAAVEVPSIASGTVTWLAGEAGDVIAIGSPFVKLEILGDGNEGETAAVEKHAAKEPAQETVKELEKAPPSSPTAQQAAPAAKFVPLKQAEPPAEANRRAPGEKPLASPAVRKRALDEGVDLRQVAGSGPAGRIMHQDLDNFLAHGPQIVSGVSSRRNTSVEKIKIIGMRRKIAEKMALANARIPHITIVEEIDVDALEDLRAKLNEKYKGQRTKLTILPFMIRAIVEAVGEQGEMNAHFDDDAGIVYRYGGVHVGIAAQTDAGLTVPVVKHAEALSPWECAAEVSRLAEAARDGKATRNELAGSTITITSLGPLGAVATTPIINHPEVAIVGINKMAIRPVWDGQQFQPRKMMNISCSFDHRVIDGWDAALFVQKLKSLLETPAMLFVEG
ncbi:Dihydrolipoamide acyltransferase component of branched-chain alpha-keto acid dehydrogenase complex [hydrothermal vent metagenome]|uniref:Dihydrolipoamide acyltransferase component of branched-chain alpha-keto acid dehydrogenase complex n=1 Tax=hydrothermal vent metagenome TaxID=652676 RepID=A0A3B0TZW6_9ZZZZ